jgi:hypothetical protein
MVSTLALSCAASPQSRLAVACKSRNVVIAASHSSSIPAAAGMVKKRSTSDDSKTAERSGGRSGENLGHFSSLVDVVVIARKLTYGNSVAIPAIAETKNMRRYRKDSWLGDLDSNH